jgi:hypothetical protein
MRGQDAANGLLHSRFLPTILEGVEVVDGVSLLPGQHVEIHTRTAIIAIMRELVVVNQTKFVMNTCTIQSWNQSVLEVSVYSLKPYVRLCWLVKANLSLNLIYKGSHDSVVDIATGYGLDVRGVRVRVPVGSRIFSSPSRPGQLRGPPNLLSHLYRGSFPGGKAAVT